MKTNAQVVQADKDMALASVLKARMAIRRGWKGDAAEAAKQLKAAAFWRRQAVTSKAMGISIPDLNDIDYTMADKLREEIANSGDC